MNKIWICAISVLLIMFSTSCKKSKGVEIETVKDCEGNSYPVVKIGSQYWMAENLRSTKYDTQSESVGRVLTVSADAAIAPYYTDGRNASSEYSEKLTAALRGKLGLLYNWAAAVGLPTEEKAKGQTDGFAAQRQGICPNGWHIPTRIEWSAMAEAIGGVYDDYLFKGVGAKLRSASGWHETEEFVAGTDNYRFTVLPGGFANGENVLNIGYYGGFWTASPSDENNAYNVYFVSVDNDAHCMLREKLSALSVRCVKNIQ